MKTLLLVSLVLALSGCAQFHSVQTETAPDGTIRKTDVTSFTFFDSSSDLAKMRASTTDKTQSLNIGGLTQESAATNLVTIIGAVAEGVSAGTAKGLKP